MTTKPNPIVAVGKVHFGNKLPLALIAGPCALETRAHAFDMAGALKEITARLGIGLIYKTSFDKANRTSAKSARGIGLDKALAIFAELRKKLGVAVLTDVHEPDQCAPVAEAVDILQIPAFLCRQTDLLVAAAKTGRAINVKKGQFLAPWDMANVVQKITGAGNRNVLVTERGVSTPPIRCSSRAGRGPPRAASASSCRCSRVRPWRSASPACLLRRTRTPIGRRRMAQT
jgi:2-dehydro-3-deoxyphosphooctonate aldolase (KDO 8-P synthase)